MLDYKTSENDRSNRIHGEDKTELYSFLNLNKVTYERNCRIVKNKYRNVIVTIGLLSEGKTRKSKTCKRWRDQLQGILLDSEETNKSYLDDDDNQ
jgi:hypothetical protein